MEIRKLVLIRCLYDHFKEFYALPTIPIYVCRFYIHVWEISTTHKIFKMVVETSDFSSFYIVERAYLRSAYKLLNFSWNHLNELFLAIFSWNSVEEIFNIPNKLLYFNIMKYILNEYINMNTLIFHWNI